MNCLCTVVSVAVVPYIPAPDGSQTAKLANIDRDDVSNGLAVFIAPERLSFVTPPVLLGRAGYDFLVMSGTII